MGDSPHDVEPRVSFLIGGAQKAGTTALAAALRRHPRIALPAGKEAHVFDAPDFEDGCSVADVDARYAPHFPPGAADDALFGDATPIYCFHPRLVARIAAYNPRMKWILLLRHPVDRALSQYHMERNRGDETWPLWPALLLERWRLRGRMDDFSPGSPMRHHSYRARGDYARQLDTLRAAFPEDQLLLLRSDELRLDPAAVLHRVCGFLGVDEASTVVSQEPVFVGEYDRWGRNG